jgi:hypothetical protein
MLWRKEFKGELQKIKLEEKGEKREIEEEEIEEKVEKKT